MIPGGEDVGLTPRIDLEGVGRIRGEIPELGAAINDVNIFREPRVWVNRMDVGTWGDMAMWDITDRGCRIMDMGRMVNKWVSIWVGRALPRHRIWTNLRWLG